MPVDPQAAALLAQLPLLSTGTQSAQELRERMAGFGDAMRKTSDVVPVREVRDSTLPGPAGDIPIRIYSPAPADAGPQAGLVYFHGGGFVTGGLDSHDAICRVLATQTPCTVVAVDYRLAPEHPFPAAVDDSFAATQWVASHAAELGIDASRIAVCGDSAGGNLSAVVSLLAKRACAPKIAFQALIYPACGGDKAKHPSLTQYNKGYLLTEEDMQFFWECYVGSSPPGPQDERLHPILAPDLAGLPPALVVTAEYDVLRDEGADYARHLEAAGVPTEYKCYEGQLHGFVSMAGVVDRAAVALKDISAALAKALQVPAAQNAALAAEA